MIKSGRERRESHTEMMKRTPGIWLLAIRKSLRCQSQPSDVSNPATRSSSVGCLSNLRDAIHGCKKHKKKKAPNCCSKVVGSTSSEHHKTNVTSNEIGLHNVGPSNEGNSNSGRMAKLEDPTCEHSRVHYGGSPVVCQICGEKHKRRSINAIGSPHISRQYAVSELLEGDSSRKIVEIICQTGQQHDQSNKQHIEIETILKVHNMQNILTWFEDYRETVKLKARKQAKKVDPRCLADGNELLRFYATTVACSLGRSGGGSGSSGLCNIDNCGACRILRNGFSANKDFVGRVGIFATSTSERALEYVEQEINKRKALFVCRVIAGKIHSPLRRFDQGFLDYSGFDSLACKVGRNREAEELFVLSPRALLPCFVVIYKI